ncbi:hypothetical protein [Streptococcus sp. S784/96/1]|uniref:hypothetical protein n=1 Tax=Streptococcus sp. S784/96/1 TaxID=2653499 RepID=UPI00236889B7|nr:hypothetical protein [Streptococcus sp. S784/96/1]
MASIKNLLLGFDEPSDYGKNTLYAVQTIGRTAGRIGKGQATIYWWKSLSIAY